MAITLKDVASVAGVSTATVSRALAGSESVAPQTASHIKTIADDLGYRFDNVARALRKKRSNLVGLVAPDYAFPYAREFLIALNRELFRAELVLASAASFGSPQNELLQVERLLSQRVDALLILPASQIHSAAAIETALAEDVPVIQLQRPVDDPRTTSFVLDYEAGLEFALRFLRPETPIAYCGGASLAADGKRAAFRRVMSRRGLNAWAIHDFDAEAASLAGRWRPAGEAPRLIVCDSYPLARELSRLGAAPHTCAERPPIVCLDAAPAENARTIDGVITVEFPMVGLARVLVDDMSRALQDKQYQPRRARLQPVLNLSRAALP